MFKLCFRPKVLEILKNLERKIQFKINSSLDELRAEKFISLNIKKIEGTRFGYRLRLGRWRILFAFFQKEKRIEIVDIFLKKDRGDYRKRKHLLS